ncbi:MAG: biotin synthase BioB [Capsulimonadaceae bacterium]
MISIERVETAERITVPSRRNWQALAEHVLAGEPLSRADGVAMLQSEDSELLTLLAAAYEIRRTFFGNKVQLYYLMNIKSGLCAEDCHYCSQSRLSTAPVSRYPVLSRDQIVAGALRAAENGACTYCIVASGRGPTDRELDQVIDAVRKIRDTVSIRICACLGILKEGQAERLKAAGVDRYNHNLNSSEDFHGEVVTTHTFEDRIRTNRMAHEAGMSTCSGGLIGMGESDEDVVSLAFALRDIEAESIPVNFLIPFDGTPFGRVRTLNPRYCLKVLCLFRFVNPSREIRIAGGREVHLRSLQPMGLYAANSIFVSDYLTSKGQEAGDDFLMLDDLGFEVVAPVHAEDGH